MDTTNIEKSIESTLYSVKYLRHDLTREEQIRFLETLSEQLDFEQFAQDIIGEHVHATIYESEYELRKRLEIELQEERAKVRELAEQLAKNIPVAAIQSLLRF